MAKKKGSPKTGGRKKGTPNKVSTNGKKAIQEVFENLGGAEGLKMWAMKDERNLEAFYTKIFPRVVPTALANDEERPLLPSLNIMLSSDG